MTAIEGRTFHLRRYFSIASGILMLAVALPLVYAYHRSEVRELTELVGLRNEALARTYANTLWPAFGDFLLRRDIEIGVRKEHEYTAELDRNIRQMSRDAMVTKIKVFNLDGIAVFSSVPKEIGEEKSRNSGFVMARNGELINELTHRGMISGTEGEIHNVDVVSTYIPIYRENSREVMAVFELYSDVTDTIARIQTVTIRLLLALLAVFFALYLSLLAIVARADRFIQRQYLALADSEAGLKAQKEALEREIKERREIEEALRRSEEVAASASRAKSEFLSSMSHELRTPMNAILGFTQLLESEPDAPLTESQQRFVRQIMKAGSHLLTLIDQVLDLARIEAGRLTLSVEPVSLSAVLDETLPMVQHLASKTGVAPITIDVDDFRVAADYGRLKQVLLNLLSNAIKYNRTGGSVAVSARASGDQVRIAVADTGKGIPAARIGELFKPFNRLGLESAAIEGTGIGLSVSKQLIEAMGGSIGVESVEGGGSSFWLLLPRASASQGAAAPAGKAAADGESKAIGQGAAERVILYVEDNPANVLLMEELVRRFTGVRLVSAHTAELGIAMASHFAPDLIIMDINLPGIDGFEALARLRSNPETERIPVIALSANAMPSVIQRGLAAGFRSYHTKPIQVDAFSRVVSDLLAEEGT